MTAPWLTLIGLGEDGRAGLSPAANEVSGASASGRRRRAASGAGRAAIRCETLCWPSPMDAAYPQILARRGENVVVLASGDPSFMASARCWRAWSRRRKCAACPRLRFQPGRGAAWLGAAGLRARSPCMDARWKRSFPDCRTAQRSSPCPGTRARRANSRRCWRARVRRLAADHLRTPRRPREQVRAALARDFALEEIANLIRLRSISSRTAARISAVRARPAGSFFEHDGQITKAEFRALTLSALAPRRGELLWDIGAGSGSVAIEFLLANAANAAIAIEANFSRAERVKRNALALGTPVFAWSRAGRRRRSPTCRVRKKFSSAAAPPRRA